jgi:hypothetical protein
MDLLDYINTSPPGANVTDLPSYVAEQDYQVPIDAYRRSVRAILGYGTEHTLEANDFIGRLLLIGLVSSAEGYVRSVLSACLEICPLAQSSAASKNVNLGGLLWHGKQGYSRGAFEHASFASRRELAKAYDDYVGFKLDDVTFKTLLDEFEVVCHLRHGIVHSDGALPGRNAVQLGIPRAEKPMQIVVRYRHLQEVASVINTLVYTLNRALFKEMCKRWAVDWRSRADWDPGQENNYFGKIWTIFHSRDERELRIGRTKITRSNCAAEARAFFGI